jgi:uncharacterized membrane protein YfcA
MPDLATFLPMFLLLLAIGAFAGVISGLLGVGGGIILVPAFYYAFSALGWGSETLMRICIATSLATIIVTSSRSAHAHNRRGAVDWGILRGWAPGIVVGAVIAVGVVAWLQTTALQVIFGLLSLIVAGYLGLGKADWRLGPAMPTGARRVVLSPVVGFLSVLMGIGGGSFGVPLMSLHGVPIHRAVATAAGWGVVIAVPSVAVFLFTNVPNAPPYTLGAVNLPAFATIIAMTLLTAPLGVRLAHALDARPLKRIFALFLAIVALNMLRKAAGW